MDIVDTESSAIGLISLIADVRHILPLHVLKLPFPRLFFYFLILSKFIII